MSGRTMHRVLGGLGAGVGALVLLFVVGAWLATRGPLSVPFLVPLIEQELTAAVEDAGLDLDVTVGEAVVLWRGIERGLDVRLHAVQLGSAEKGAPAEVGTVEAALDGRALLEGTVHLSGLALVGSTVRVIRTPEGTVQLASGPGPAALAGVSPPATEDGTEEGAAPGGAGLSPDVIVNAWGRLADLGLALRNARLVFDDRMTDQVWLATIGHLTATRDGEAALIVETSVRVQTRPAEASETAPHEDPYEDGAGPSLDLALRHEMTSGTASGLVALHDINPSRDLAPLAAVADVPALAGWDQHLEGTVTLDIAFEGDAPETWFRFASLSVVGGAGSVTAPPPVDRPYALDDLTVEATLDRAPESGRLTLTVEQGHIGLDGVALAATGALTVDPGGPAVGYADLSTSTVTVPVVERLWPGSLAHGAIEWIGHNLSDGVVVGTQMRATLAGGSLADLTLTDLSGDAGLFGMTVNYLDGLPPATDAHGRLRFGLETVEVDVSGGGVGAVRVTDGHAVFSDFDADVERADLTFDIVGPLADALALIDHEPLGYASKVGIDPASLRGDAKATLTLGMPLLKDLPLEDLEIGVEASAEGVGVPEVLLNQDLSAGDLDLSLTQDGMDVNGTARLGPVPVRLTWRENFTDGAPFDRRYRVKARVDAAGRKAFGLHGVPFQPPWLDGPVEAVATYTEAEGKPGRLTADLDLTPASLSVGPLGWSKPAGVAGRAAVKGTFSDDAMVIDFDVTSPAGATVAGQARLNGEGGLRDITVDPIRLGADTDARALVRAETDPERVIRVTVAGRSVDLRAALGGDDARPAEEADPGPDAEAGGGALRTLEPGAAADSGTALDLALAVERVRMTDTIALTDVNATAIRDAAGHWRSGDVDARIGGGPEIVVHLTPEGAGLARTLTARAGDAGAVAAALGVIDQLRGGTLSLDGTLDAEDRLSGTLTIRDFHLAEAPLLARILAVASLTGILDELQGDGLSLSRLVAPFTYADSLLTLSEARTNGPSLGLTANGTINIDTGRLDLTGVVVPAYVVNALLGKIPVVGDILVGEKGGGVFAVGYGATGTLDDPDVSVNPLTVLTPGALRGVFGDGTSDGDDGPVTMPSVGPPD
ncbi:hypothetical protein F1188_14435 [Roseospira marina]|uniref:DUF3971 domain-containing protein n=1 Tax=Roseospira marina TaxID=140057 RepID=A0A5M6I9E5_9PROT|nr:AsmA-like C-terminal domain-containing protein [Roseospira marina]KAA5604803.1 hypothetical protein F1188_14435 [Roseospira marina]MBB4313494.1 hypothetical protein [Roseospira marina]MBB5086656.1 hypothetical protein [Roseospira marina]